MKLLLVVAAALFAAVAALVVVGLRVLEKFDGPFEDDGDWGLGG